MFVPGYHNEVQIMASVLSFDQENEPETLAMIASFAALHLSPIPFMGPMGAVRLGWLDGNILINPTRSILQDERCRLDLTLAATPEAVVMVEAGAQELPEKEIVRALRAGYEVCRTICEMCEELRQLAASPPKLEVTPPESDSEMLAAVESELGAERLQQALLTPGKHDRDAAVAALRDEVVAALVPDEGDEEEVAGRRDRAKRAFTELANAAERRLILEGTRTDGRGTRDVRPIDIQVGILPRTHGSALFTRGETQALVTLTLGSADDEQIIDGLNAEEERRRFLLHYNFPPFSVGEARPIRGTSRREYGHGALAERALRPLLPDYEEFPYTLRIVSDILESNGSSSMATVCGSSLAMMDGGVPVRKAVAGIAMGLVKEGERYVILSDIQGSEDHHGDMDFKVAGTRDGITALQMDIKVKGLSDAILTEALEQAREGRLHILDCMDRVLDRPRAQISAHAPINKTVMVPTEKIGFVIGPRGATIRKLQERFGVDINVMDDGTVQVSGSPVQRVDAALETIREMTREIEIGSRVEKARVVSVKPFGCFVDLGGGQEGMCHISELDETRIREVEDICQVGDEIPVVVVSKDDHGKIRVSRRLALLPEEELAAALESAQRPPSGGRGGGRSGGRGDRRGDRRGDSRGERRRSGSQAPA